MSKRVTGSRRDDEPTLPATPPFRLSWSSRARPCSVAECDAATYDYCPCCGRRFCDAHGAQHPFTCDGYGAQEARESYAQWVAQRDQTNGKTESERRGTR